MDGGGGGRRPRAVFMAFGTRGDVFPIAALAAAFAQDQRQYGVVFITHSAHQTVMLDICLCQAHLSLLPNSSRASHRKKTIQVEHRRECLSAVENVFGNDMSTHGDFIVINFFALEGWHLAELFQVKCIIAAPYFVPYSAPASFERQFKQSLPLLYKYFQEAPLNMDPVTNLPLWYTREESPLLLYGFSKEIVECPVAIHHAGSGSTAAALFAGIPQISCPFLLDQFYWAERLHWLGVAPEPLGRQHLIPDTDNASSINSAADMLIGAIKSALSPEIKAQATRIANKLSSEATGLEKPSGS
uniref:Erythromycin biosynthesis protein CIII-like C-terminal domain-containing protein n=1 Tax=Oryza nivara TaxID=4536 RepID=A0A0E0G2T8_ORYNI